MTRPMFDYPSDWEIVDLTPSEKNDIILNLLDLTIICLFLTILLLDMNFKLIAPRMGSV